MIRKFALLVLTLCLSACVIPTGPVDVTRFNRAAEGFVYGSGSYTIVTASDALTMSPYIASVAREMRRVGYNEKPLESDVVAEVAVDIVRAAVKKDSPVSVGVGGSTGSYRSGGGVGVGINLGGGAGERVTTTLRVRLLRRSDDLVIWEGRAVQSADAKSPAAQPGIAASKLASALFQDFPGESGETISVP
ncbi:MAG: hypothetical protein RL481_1060 [Pseudomonadota bacterium]|jgi:hypothetical protein